MVSDSLSPPLPLSLTCTPSHVQCTFPLWSLMLGQWTGPTPKYLYTCNHQPTVFLWEHDALPEAAQFTKRGIHNNLHTHTSIYTQKHVHIVVTYNVILSLTCIYNVHIPHMHTFTSVDLCVLEADWRHCIGLTEGRLSSSRC